MSCDKDNNVEVPKSILRRMCQRTLNYPPTQGYNSIRNQKILEEVISGRDFGVI